jgi:hypothetical protein
MTEEETPLDHGLVAPLALPPDSKVPDPETGASNDAEYDLYFRIVRDDPGLLEWSRTCMRIDRELLEDLERTSLSAEEKYRVLQGLVTVYGITLERWVTAGDAALAATEAPLRRSRDEEEDR